jgi:Flp pilus assembly pilin Flp
MMNLLNIFKRFKNDESGAVTVDWVVLTGAVVALGVTVAATIGGSVNTRSTAITNQITGNAPAAPATPPAQN